MNVKKIIYSILKEVEKGNEPKAEDLGISKEDFVKAAKIIKQEEYLDNIAIAATIVFLNNCNVTMKGYEFIEENSAWAKTYRGLKELRDWLK
jgi:hypothetical protein